MFKFIHLLTIIMKQNPIDYRENESIVQIQGIKETAILDLVPFAIYITDTDGKISYYNHAAKELWGREPAFG